MMRWLLPLLISVACHQSADPHTDRAAPALRAEPKVATALPNYSRDKITPPNLEPAIVERVPVGKDADAAVVRSLYGSSARILFLPGLCSNAAAYLTTFPEAARSHGGVVAIDGDQPCGAPNSGFHSFTWSATLQRSRIDDAMAAANVTAPEDGFTLVGYSAGASIAEMMQERWPALFPRLIIIAPPSDPPVEKLLKAQAVVSMSCSFDVPYRMKDAANKVKAKGVPALYVEMPKCTHGNIADGEHVFNEAFDWLDSAAINSDQTGL